MISLNLALQIDNLSKCFRIGRQKEFEQGILDKAVGFFKSPIQNFRLNRSLYKFTEFDNCSEEEATAMELEDLIWALRHVSLDVKRGEILGIIGSNGAGKSTLLKIISRITDPTYGAVEIRGRVSSLLEVGTGFHPELTGRENVYLNGTIHGLKKNEIDQKFDEIVEFSGVEKFLDTPVKRYSSGMRVRLGFSVAAHLSPDVLIIDEVLAVGDAEFQRKCLSKMQTVGEAGRTVLFVSHSMPAITRLCTRAIILEQGRLVEDGPAAAVVNAYLKKGSATPVGKTWDNPAAAPSGSHTRLLGLRICDETGMGLTTVDIRKGFGIELSWEVFREGLSVQPHLGLLNEDGQIIFMTIDLDPLWRGKRRARGRYVSTAWVPGNLLSEGMIFVDVHLIGREDYAHQLRVDSAIAFQVADSLDGDSARGDYGGVFPGAVRPLLKWTTRYTPELPR